MINHREPHPIAMFDDALPERLLGSNFDSSESARVPLQTGTAQLSPFIVKLTRHTPANQTATEQLEDPLVALAQSLIIEHDDVLDEAALVEACVDDQGLKLSLCDFKPQMSEFERETGFVPNAVTCVRSESTIFPPIGSSDILARPDTIDVVALLSVAEKLPEANDVARPEHRLMPTFVGREPGWQRALAAFVGLAVAAVLPLQALQVFANAQVDGGEIALESQAALQTFLRGATSLSTEDFAEAGQDFSEAVHGFALAEASLEDMHAGVLLLASVVPKTNRTVDSVSALVSAGRELSETAVVMSTAANDLADQDSLDITTKLELLGAYIEHALPHAQAAALALDSVDVAIVPAEYSERVNQLQILAPRLVLALEEYVKFVDTLGLILGGEDKMRYLAVFQNNTELRPTGGFVGSFAELDIAHGEVVRLFTPGGGSYAVQGQQQAFVAAPGPLQLLKARWEFQDANWFPDFPSSAKKLNWFYAMAGGPTTDGVVAVNATFVAKLLDLLGPVDMPAYGRTFNAENFIFETQKIVELEYDRELNEPKEIIGDLAPILFERVQQADIKTLLAVVELVAQGLEEKDIQLNFRDNQLQSAVAGLGWSGQIKQTAGDYLMVVNTNLGGGKTDGVIDQSIQVDVQVAVDGTIENTVTITKTHRGLKTDLFAGKNNVDYLRLYVPEGSELISVAGFEIPPDELFETFDSPLSVDQDLLLYMQDVDKHEASGTDIWTENGKTVFGNWMQTATGEVEVLTFTYRLPLRLFETATPAVSKLIKSLLSQPDTSNYSMLIQKQSGVEHRSTQVDLHLPTGMWPLWSSTGDTQSLQLLTDNATDSYAGWLIAK